MGIVKLQKNLTYGQLRFLVNDVCVSYIDSNGWHNKIAPDMGSGCSKIEIIYDSNNSFWKIDIDNSTVAWIDGN